MDLNLKIGQYEQEFMISNENIFKLNNDNQILNETIDILKKDISSISKL